eukprot:1578154-Amphidinium_carterae.1
MFEILGRPIFDLLLTYFSCFLGLGGGSRGSGTSKEFPLGLAHLQLSYTVGVSISVASKKIARQCLEKGGNTNLCEGYVQICWPLTVGRTSRSDTLREAVYDYELRGQLRSSRQAKTGTDSLSSLFKL